MGLPSRGTDRTVTRKASLDDVFSTTDIGIAVVLLALSVRFAVGLSTYSGAADPPKYGDYEAQRHWMELTVNLPVHKWYTATPTWWPLDYPPLSGYQSWLFGKALELYEPEAVEYDSSRGYETPSSKTFMRSTVVASDLLVFIPAAWLCARTFLPDRSRAAPNFLLWSSLLLQPASILVDHGHFQYNTIGLGLSAAAAAAVAGGRHILGSILFCLSMNHKQMGLFYAPAFFAHLLGRCLQTPGGTRKVLAVAKLGVVVLATFALCWAPYLHPEAALQVLKRVLPVKRGLYEDYVANFWCSTSVLIKWKTLFDQAVLIKACAVAALLGSANAMVHQILRPSKSGLLLSMFNTATAFYMFAFHVHEKSILLPLLPLTVLAPTEPFWAAWAPIVASFSMFPLLVRDGVSLAYAGCILLYFAVMMPILHGPCRQHNPTDAAKATDSSSKATDGTHTKGQKLQKGGAGHSSINNGKHCGGGCVVVACGFVERHEGMLKAVAVYGSLCCFVLLHLAKELVPPPTRLPWLYDRLFITMSFVHFVVLQLYMNVRQWYSAQLDGV